MKRAHLLPLVFFSLAPMQTLAASLRVDCVEGCLPRGTDPTVDLLLRADETGPITLRWEAAEDPSPGKETLRLSAGNPVLQDQIPDRGELSFVQVGALWQTSYTVPAEDLGRGTFLTVLVGKRGGEEEILDWRAFRLLTRAERDRQEQGPDPSGAWSIDVRPAVLQATSGRGELPRSRGGDERVWWPIAQVGSDTSDLDLDGEHTGIPGLGIQVSTPWAAGVGATDWKQAILDKLTGVEGHTVRFGELRWVEKPDREIGPVEGLGEVKLRHYYTLVTLFTNASLKTFDAKEVGGGGLFSNPTYFSHETSARLKHTRDLRFWASYSLREYGSDQRLLDLLRKKSRRDSTVPGLGRIQQDDGDGGSITYRAGFVARARPWAEPGGPSKLRAGFVGVDVVAARAGYGGVQTEGSAGLSDLQKALCQVIRCGQEGRPLDLDQPPPGYEVAQPAAALATLSGSIAMSEGKPLLAQRALPPAGPGSAARLVPNLPSLTRFALAANLRAGAVIRKGSWGHARNLVPINSYAQYVLKLTVAMGPGTTMVTSDEAVMPSPGELNVHAPLPRARGLLAWVSSQLAKLGFAMVVPWIRSHLASVGIAIVLVASSVLVVVVPGSRRIVRALLKKLSGRP